MVASVEPFFIHVQCLHLSPLQLASGRFLWLLEKLASVAKHMAIHLNMGRPFL